MQSSRCSFSQTCSKEDTVNRGSRWNRYLLIQIPDLSRALHFRPSTQQDLRAGKMLSFLAPILQCFAAFASPRLLLFLSSYWGTQRVTKIPNWHSHNLSAPLEKYQFTSMLLHFVWRTGTKIVSHVMLALIVVIQSGHGINFESQLGCSVLTCNDEALGICYTSDYHL